MTSSPTVQFTRGWRDIFVGTSGEGGLKNRCVRRSLAFSGYAQSVPQTMGFQDIAGDRRFVRHIKFTTEKGEVVEVRLVYDYCESGLDVTKA